MLENIKRINHKFLKIKKKILDRIKDSLTFADSYFKNELQYLEFHVTDHCNLKCKACWHYSNIADKFFADPSVFERDMTQLSKIFNNIKTIRLMGGEPLLHPNLSSFIKSARRSFPSAKIDIITNGTLLKKADRTFWDTCRETNTTIALTVYPPTRNTVSHLVELANKNNVKLTDSPITWTFFTNINIHGNSDKERAFKACRKMFYIPFLKDGNIFVCPQPALIHIFNEKFNKSITTGNGINIYKHTGREIINYLSKPSEKCKSCEYAPTIFSWDRGKGTIEEWLPETYQKT
ncbi:MAG: radical SAM protein [Chlorobiaceae bacterium]|nr:radical SAM protein [Chlorobiaceae bacterium]